MPGSQWKLEQTGIQTPEEEHPLHLFYSSVQPSRYQQTSTAGWLLNLKELLKKKKKKKPRTKSIIVCL